MCACWAVMTFPVLHYPTPSSPRRRGLDRWQLSKNMANELIGATKVVKNLTAIAVVPSKGAGKAISRR
jgi:hypothetical protein